MIRNLMSRVVVAAVVIATAGLLAASASARSSAVPAQTSSPTLQGSYEQPFVGDTISTSNGSWSGSPTKYAYQWSRCNATGDRQGCVTIPGATSQSYVIQKADANHTLKADVHATNAEGTGTADTKGSGVVSDTTAPVNRSRPTISGSPSVGSTLTVNNGTWTGATTFSYQWQQCDTAGNNCVNISGATGKTYGVRVTDVGHEIRAQVTATNKYGTRTVATDRTSIVGAVNTQTSTTVVVTTVAGNDSPTLSFLSLKRVGVKIYARFRVCDDSGRRVTVVERDNKAHTVSYTRRFAVTPLTCGTYARHWTLVKRFRTRGHLVVTLRAQDAAGRSSRLVSRGLTIR
jgi:hypothetical protein